MRLKPDAPPAEAPPLLAGRRLERADTACEPSKPPKASPRLLHDRPLRRYVATEIFPRTWRQQWASTTGQYRRTRPPTIRRTTPTANPATSAGPAPEATASDRPRVTAPSPDRTDHYRCVLGLGHAHRPGVAQSLGRHPAAPVRTRHLVHLGPGRGPIRCPRP